MDLDQFSIDSVERREQIFHAEPGPPRGSPRWFPRLVLERDADLAAGGSAIAKARHHEFGAGSGEVQPVCGPVALVDFSDQFRCIVQRLRLTTSGCGERAGRTRVSQDMCSQSPLRPATGSPP